MIVLGIETSCDETSAAVLKDGVVLANIISSQIIHRRYGGVVPELASRAHQRLIVPVVDEALTVAGVDKAALGAVAVTYGPGLMGSLLVGVNFAKALAFALGVPLVGVNHMEAHLYSTFLSEPSPGYPFLCLIVSGGHTQLMHVRAPMEHELLGETLDDAAGEAYDKVAKMLGLGFPGGPAIDRLAAKGNPAFIRFPRSLPAGDDFSFSGVKTAVLYWLRDHAGKVPGDHRPLEDERLLADLCASFQECVVDVLIEKTRAALRRLHPPAVAVAGGVSANSALRRRFAQLGREEGVRVVLPEMDYCTDNGAMIAMAGWMRLRAGYASPRDLSAVPNLAFGDVPLTAERPEAHG
jgi:N6-L-threonylcarbamoyladenine synthase